RGVLSTRGGTPPSPSTVIARRWRGAFRGRQGPAMDKESPLERHRRVGEAAEDTDFVLSRTMLRALGVDRHQTKRQIAAGRWVREVGEDSAVGDGGSAPQAAGLTGGSEAVVHVSILHRHDPTRLAGVTVHKVIRRVEGEVVGAGAPRTTPAVAAIRAAHWAV